MATSHTATLPWDQRLARRLVVRLARFPIHPNFVTAVGLMLGVGSGFLFATGDHFLADVGAFAFVLAVFIDHADGELARRTGKTSRFGHQFDRFAMLASNISLFVGMGAGLQGSVLGETAIILGIIAGLAVFGIFAIRSHAARMMGDQVLAHDNFAGFEFEDAMYLVGPAAWFHLLVPFLVAAAIGAPLFLLLTAWQTSRGRSVTQRWWRQT